MDAIAGLLAWANHLLARTWLLWFGAAVVIGGIMLALDEWRLHRARPKPEGVRAFADDLEARHGREAFRVNGDAMWQARLAKDFVRYRFLAEVSGELARRLVEHEPPRSVADGGPRDVRRGRESGSG